MEITKKQLTTILLSELLIKSTSIKTNDDIVELTSNLANRIDKVYSAPDELALLREFKRRRSELNVTLREVSDSTGISSSTICRIEHGNDCSFGNVIKLDKWYRDQNV